MSKPQIVWLFVRLFGVFLCYQGFHALINLLGMIMLISDMKEKNLSLPVVGQQFLLTAFYIGIGIYLLMDGSFLFGLVNREETTDASMSNEIAEEVSISEEDSSEV